MKLEKCEKTCMKLIINYFREEKKSKSMMRNSTRLKSNFTRKEKTPQILQKKWLLRFKIRLIYRGDKR